MASFRPVRQIRAGEPVTAGVASRPDVALTQRTDALRDRINAIDAGKTLIDTGAALDTGVLEGQPVYWNATTLRYEQALAAVEHDEASGTLVQQASSDCLGMVLRKTSAAVGDVMLGGVAPFTGLANAI